MSVGLKKSSSNGCEKPLTFEEQQIKINEVRKLIGQLPERLSFFCSDASISRYLRARNLNVKKATKMLKETLKWRAEYKPEEIRWDDVAHEAVTGKIYRSNYVDKHGRTVLVMRPACQVVKPFLEPKTQNKVKFVYSDDLNSKKIVEELFDVQQLESAFGGNDNSGFNITKYAERMREDDKRMPSFWTRENPSTVAPQSALTSTTLDSLNLKSDSESSENDKAVTSPCHEIELEVGSPDEAVLATDGSKNIIGEVH